MALDEVSGGTPSQVYGDGTEDTVVEDRDDLPDATGEFALPRIVCGLWLTWVLPVGRDVEGPVGGSAFVCAAPAEGPRGGDNAGAAGGGSDREGGGVGAAAFAAAGLANLGPLVSSDFKVSAGAAAVCEEVSNFTAPPCVSELFKRWSTQAMFRSMEANAVKVGPCRHAPPLWAKF